MNSRQNPNCQGGFCTEPDGEVRVLDKLHVCYSCYEHEINWRCEQDCRLEEMPEWESLQVWEGMA